MNETLAKTPIHEWHVEQGARMTGFAGWDMPIQYTSIVAEHEATRTAAGVFDVSHMGRIRFDGNGSAAFLDRLLTRRVLDMEPGMIRYSLVTNEAGGILDDVLVYYLSKPSGALYHLLVVNASNRAKILDWISQQIRPDDECIVSDRTEETAMIAVQGPRALEIVNPLVDVDVTKLKYYRGRVTKQMGKPCTVTRTGYTGEDGCELIVRADDARLILENVFRSGRDKGITPAGLGARDTLRLESAMPLYGHELNEQITPYQAGLGFAVQLADRDFVGHAALSAAKAEPSSLVRIGLRLEGKRAAREHYPVLSKDEQVGEVTSGTFSPTLQQPIAMAYIDRQVPHEAGSSLIVDIRGKPCQATVARLPFYTRAK